MSSYGGGGNGRLSGRPHPLVANQHRRSSQQQQQQQQRRGSYYTDRSSHRSQGETPPAPAYTKRGRRGSYPDLITRDSYTAEKAPLAASSPYLETPPSRGSYADKAPPRIYVEKIPRRTDYEEDDPKGSAAAAAARPWWRRPVPLIWTLLVVGVIVIVVVVGAVVGTKDKSDDVHTRALNLPSQGLGQDMAGMRTPGSFYTSSSDYSAIDHVFEWHVGSVTSDPSGDVTNADIVINTTQVYQVMDGFGAAFTDSSCWLLQQLKQKNASEYEAIMDYFFSERTGMSTIRVPIGSSDYSAQGVYTFAADNSSQVALATNYQYGNISNPLASFSINRTQDYILPVLRDAVKRRPDLKIMFTAWTPPPWMKTSNQTNGGQLIGGTESLYAQYLAESVDAFAKAGVHGTSMSVQNEPLKGFEGYPSNWMSAQSQNAVALSLKSQLRAMGHTSMKILAHDDNWDGWQSALTSIQTNTSVFDGIAWHCYDGSASEMDNFYGALNQSSTTGPLEGHLTECTTTDGSRNQWWSTQFWLRDFYFAPINRGIRSIMTWNVVLDSESKPYIDGAPCLNCQGTFELSSPENFMDPPIKAINAQFITTFHFAAATSNLTRFGGGPSYRVDMRNGTQPQLGSKLGCLSQYAAFAAPWNGTDLTATGERRLSLVVQNDCSSKVSAVLNIDGRKGSFAFSSGLTTLVV